MNISSDQLAKKLAFKKTGPFLVIGSLAYELRIPKMWKNLHPVINKLKLRPYHRPIFTQQETSLTVITPSQESTTQEVERFLDSKILGGWPTVSCQVVGTALWRVYPFEESTWKNRSEIIKEALQLYRDFQNSYPSTLKVPTIQVPGKSYSKVARTWPSEGDNVTVCLMT